MPPTTIGIRAGVLWVAVEAVRPATDGSGPPSAPRTAVSRGFQNSSKRSPARLHRISCGRTASTSLQNSGLFRLRQSHGDPSSVIDLCKSRRRERRIAVEPQKANSDSPFSPLHHEAIRDQLRSRRQALVLCETPAARYPGDGPFHSPAETQNHALLTSAGLLMISRTDPSPKFPRLEASFCP